jgi:hypothetical protein
MAAPNVDIFVPGGRRFTLITPFAPSGHPTTVLIPMLAPGQSTSDLSHLIKKRPASFSSALQPQSHPESHLAHLVKKRPRSPSPAPESRKYVLAEVVITLTDQEISPIAYGPIITMISRLDMQELQ